MPNLYEPEWEAERDAPPFRWRRARLAAEAGARDLRDYVPGTAPPDGGLDVWTGPSST